MTLKQKLNHIVTEYDKKEQVKAAKSKRGYYNHYALGIYFNRIDEVCEEIEKGGNVKKVLMNNFSDRLLTFILKDLGLNNID